MEDTLKLIQQGIKVLASNCDGAVTVDGKGFNKYDAYVGHQLAQLPEDQWQSKDYILAYHILTHYKGQLAEAGITLPSLEEVKALLPKKQSQRPLVTVEDGGLVFYSRFQDRDLIKKLFPKRLRWDSTKKAWRLPPVTVDNVTSFRALLEEFPATQEAKKAIATVEAQVQFFWDQLTEGLEIKVHGPQTTVPLPVKVQPYEHQIRAFEFCRRLDHSALLMEQGTGKTLVAIALLGHWWKTEGLQRALIVAPKSVMPEWERQFEELADFPYQLVLLTGSLEKRKDLLRNWPEGPGIQVAVVNYEATWRMIEELKDWGPQIVIADESQKIKNIKAQQTKAVTALGKTAKHRLILTGTPVTQSPLDFFAQYKFLDPRIFGTSFTKFRSRYALMGGYGGYQVIGYRNLEELAAKAHSIAFRVTKEECLDLPETINQFVYADLEAEAKKLYQTLRKEAIIKFSETEQVTAPIVLTELLRLQQITGGFVPVGDNHYKQISQAKLQVVRELLEDFKDSDKKVVIFARFVPEVEAIAEIAQNLGLKVFTLTGKTPVEARQQALKDFQLGDLQVFIAQIATGGVGITLTAADTAIFYSTDFSLANYEQAKARLHRIGQKSPVVYIHIMAKGTIDEEVMRRLAAKQDIANLVVDEYKYIILKGGEENMTMEKKPYFGLKPGTHEWMEVWKAHPELQDEMLEYQKLLKEREQMGAVGEVLKKEIEVTGEDLEEQIENLIEDIENMIKVEEEADTEAVEATEEVPWEEEEQTPAKPKEKNVKKEKKDSKSKTQPQVKEDKAPEKELPRVSDKIITVKDLADEFGVAPKTLRKWLRKNFAKPGGRWEWHEGSSDIEDIRRAWKEQNSEDEE